MLLALVGGSLLGALIAWAVGCVARARRRPGVGRRDRGRFDRRSPPPTTGTILVVLAQPALAAAVYTFLVAWNGRPDLGTGVDRVLMSMTVRLSTMVPVVDESVGGWPERGERVGHPQFVRVNRYIAAGRPPLGPEAAVVPVGSSMPRRVRMRCRLVGSTSCASAVA